MTVIKENNYFILVFTKDLLLNGTKNIISAKLMLVVPTTYTSRRLYLITANLLNTIGNGILSSLLIRGTFLFSC